MMQAEITATNHAVLPLHAQAYAAPTSRASFRNRQASALFGPPPRRRTMIVRALLVVAYAWAFALLNILSAKG